MKLKKNMMLLLVGGAVALVLLVGAFLLLVRFNLTYRKVNNELKAGMRRLNELYDRDPYPSEENVVLLQTNVAVLGQYFDAIDASFREGQIEAEEMKPAEFPLILEKTIRGLTIRANELGVKLPPRFAFGFEKYAVGALPADADVPRLVLQLETVEKLCGLLYDARIAGVDIVARQVFEQDLSALGQPGAPQQGQGGSRRRGGGAETTSYQLPKEEWVDSSGLFSREKFVIEFSARDSALWDVLNRFVRSKPFVVVSRVEFVNPKPLAKIAPSTRQPAAAAPGMPGYQAMQGIVPAKAKEEIKPYEERIMAGRELVKAVVEVDVYRFRAREKQEAAP